MSSKTADKRHPSSFRDPEGFIISVKDSVYRVVGPKEKNNYEKLMNSGLYEKVTKKGLLIKHREVASSKIDHGLSEDSIYKLLKPEMIPFISYPYEWSFDELKSAALLTLELLKTSIEHDMTLKDASAYNVQFIGTNPIFIDTTSFTLRKDKPWEGYKQFCEHFLAPLALMAYGDQYLHRMSQLYIDGIPLSIAAKILPRKARFNFGLLQHIFAHAKAQSRHKDAGAKHIEQGKDKVKIPTMTKFKQLAVIESLERTVMSLKPSGHETEWGDYYEFTNYNKKSFDAKRKKVKELITQCNPKSVWDFGANNGEFSSLAANQGIYTVAFDIDPNAVNKNFQRFKDNDLMLPLLLDLTNPSPAIGWNLSERHSIIDRGPADLVLALAIIHHICIGSNVPLSQVAEFLSRCCNNLIIEFVPKGDSKVETLLSTREDIFDNYTEAGFEAAFSKFFRTVSKTNIPGSKRSLYLMAKKA